MNHWFVELLEREMKKLGLKRVPVGSEVLMMAARKNAGRKGRRRIATGHSRAGRKR